MPHIPLRRRDGTIVAHTLVDENRLDELSQHRWCLDSGGYAVTSPRRGVNLRMHRVVLGLTDPLVEGDHRNGDKLDNRAENLRAVTRRQNGQNRAAMPGARSRYRGVFYQPDPRRKKVWRARVRIDGRSHHIGYFSTEDEAGEAVRDYLAENAPYAEPSRV